MNGQGCMATHNQYRKGRLEQQGNCYADMKYEVLYEEIWEETK